MATQGGPKRDKKSYDSGHVPMTEEFDSPERSLPAIVPLAVALLIVAVAVGAVFYFFRAKPVAQGGIDHVNFSRSADQSAAMLAIQVDLRNISQKPLYIKGITATLKTADGEWTDEAASPSDYPRYLEAYPDLKDGMLSPIAVETKLAPGAEQRGTIVVTFPVERAQFEARKELSVTIEPYDQKNIVFKEEPGQ